VDTTSPAPAARATPAPATADLKAIAEYSLHIMADGDRADFERTIHPAAINRERNHEPPASRGTGPASWYATALWLRTAFADLHHTVNDAVTEDDLVVLHTTMSGRHVAPFVVYDAAGEVETVFPPTGKSFAVTQTHWLRVADGKVIEHWANRDDLGQARQLGWVPPTPAYLLRMARAKRNARRHAEPAS
jgi:predicted ester cyclase